MLEPASQRRDPPQAFVRKGLKKIDLSGHQGFGDALGFYWEYDCSVMSSNDALRELVARIEVGARRFCRCEPCLRGNSQLLHIFLGALALAASACSQPASSSRNSGETGRGDLIAKGDEFAIDPETRRLMEQARTGQSSTNQGSSFSAENRWSIVLATASGPGHQAQAEGVRKNIQREYPQLRSVFVRSTGRGSAVWYGRFSASDSQEAVAARKQIQAMTRNGRQVFPSSFLSVLPDESPMGQFDLRRARLMYPGVDPLYTLQIACWGTFQSARIDWGSIQKESEAYTAQLRRRGHQAWYYHDPVTQLSVVTLGVFDRRAYDPQSTLFSPEVELLRRQFPLHLINGEEVLIELTPGDSDTQVPQECRLVTVPSLQ